MLFDSFTEIFFSRFYKFRQYILISSSSFLILLSLSSFSISFCLLRSSTCWSSSAFICWRLRSTSCCWLEQNSLESNPRLWLRYSSSFIFYLSNIQNYYVRPSEIIHHQLIIIIYMQKYLLLLFACIVLAAYSQNCQQVGTSTIAKLTLCQVRTPAPQLNWAISVTLLQNYQWRGPDEIKYLYQTQTGAEISQTCYQGQTIKGNYMKGTTLLVEHLCFGFKPSISRGDKVYLMLFWDRSSVERLIVYVSFNAAGEMQMREVDKQEGKEVMQKMTNLIIE